MPLEGNWRSICLSAALRRMLLRFQCAHAILTALILIAAVGSAGWLYYRNSRARWARNEALPKIRQLIASSDYAAAFELTRRALKYTPDDPRLKQHWSEISIPITLASTPPGVTVFYRPFGDANLPWQLVGRPSRQRPRAIGVPADSTEKPGFSDSEFAAFTLGLQGSNIPLSRAGEIPDRMVPVPARAPWAGPSNVMPLPDYFIDKFEVTNRQFQQFIDAGGYRDAKYGVIHFSKMAMKFLRSRPCCCFVTQRGGQDSPIGSSERIQRIRRTFPCQV